MEKLTYHFRTSWWFVLGFFGSLCIWGAVFVSGQIPLHMLNSREGLFDKIILILFVAIFTFFGAWTFAVLLISKISLSSEGIEFHTPAAVIKSQWTDVTVRVFQDATGKNATVHISYPEIKLRSWTRYAPWDAQKGLSHNLAHYGIPVSQFGGFAPQKFIADIQRFAQKLEK